MSNSQLGGSIGVHIHGESYIEQAAQVPKERIMKRNQILRRVRSALEMKALTGVRAPHSDTQLPRGGVVHAAGSWKKILVLTMLLAAAPSSSPFLQAGLLPTFTAGNETVGLGGSVSVPITVMDFANVAGIQFSLTWDTAVLTLQPTPVGGLISDLSGGIFGNPRAGTLTWVWADYSGVTVADSTAIFSVQFTASDILGASSSVSFRDDPTKRLAALVDGTSGVPFTFDGSVTVVPEPINWALGLFACVFIGTATVRWIVRLGPMRIGRTRVP